MSEVFVALGSNLGDRQEHIAQAMRQIIDLPGCTNLKASSLYETSPMGPQAQPDYLNAACRFNCTLDPHELLSVLKDIERQHGRSQSTARWTARPLDLDILLYGDQCIDTPTLTIPHMGLASRSFVLWPLNELDDSLVVPGLGSVRQLMEQCERFGIKRYADLQK